MLIAHGLVIDVVSGGRDIANFLSFRFIVVQSREIYVNAKQISATSG